MSEEGKGASGEWQQLQGPLYLHNSDPKPFTRHERSVTQTITGRHPFLKRESRFLRQSSNPICGFSMMEQVSLAHRELAWLFHEPHTWLEDCLRMLLTCSRKRMSDHSFSGHYYEDP